MPHNDFLDHLLEEMNKEKTILNEAIIVDMILVLLFATYESASTAMTLIVKFISDHPKVLAELTVCISTVKVFQFNLLNFSHFLVLVLFVHQRKLRKNNILIYKLCCRKSTRLF